MNLLRWLLAGSESGLETGDSLESVAASALLGHGL